MTTTRKFQLSLMDAIVVLGYRPYLGDHLTWTGATIIYHGDDWFSLKGSASDISSFMRECERFNVKPSV